MLVPVAGEVGRVGSRYERYAAARSRERRRASLVLALAVLAAAGAAASVALVTRSNGTKGPTKTAARSQNGSNRTPAIGKAVASVGVVTAVAPAPKRAAPPKPRRAPRPATTRPATVAPSRSQPRARPARPASTVAKLAPPIAAPPPAVGRAPARAAPVALGGYASGGTHVLVSGNARTLTGFIFAVRCAPKAALPPLAVHADGSFRLTGVVARRPRTTIALSGRFVDPATANLRVRFASHGCDSGLVRLTLRLS